MESVSPDPVAEGKQIEVVVRLNRALTASDESGADDDEKARSYIYSGGQRTTETPCIEGGTVVFDTYDDAMDGIFTDHLIAFKFRKRDMDNSLTKRLTHTVADDQCITPGRTVNIKIDGAFDDKKTYGYTIEDPAKTKGITVRVIGNDAINGSREDDGCAPVMEGASEIHIVDLPTSTPTNTPTPAHTNTPRPRPTSATSVPAREKGRRRSRRWWRRRWRFWRQERRGSHEVR